MKILSCIPEQRYTMADKLAWIDEQATRAGKGQIDLFVTPQEYFGGVQQTFFGTGEPLAYAPHEIVEPILALSRRHDMAIATGAVVDCPVLGERRERIWIIDHRCTNKGGVCGHADKMMLPGYDHIDAKSPIAIVPEHDLAPRSAAHLVRGARVSILFCWEVHSNYLWHAMCRAQPDLCLSMIKFGICGYPQKGKDERGGSIVAGFGFGDDGGWLERLQMAARYDLAAPIVCSTNAWDLPAKAGALVGTLLPWEEKPNANNPAGRLSTLYQSAGKGKVQQRIQVDDLDPLYWRMVRENKFAMNEAIGEWPHSEARRFTMAWKVKRMERKFCGLPTLEAPPRAEGKALARARGRAAKAAALSAQEGATLATWTTRRTPAPVPPGR